MTMLMDRFGTLLALLLPLATGLGAEPISTPHRGLSVMLPGEFLFADSGDAVEGGALFMAGSQPGPSTMVASGGLLSSAYDLALAGKHIFVSAMGRVVLVHCQTGEQRVLGGLKGDPGYALGIAIDRKENLLVANGVALMEVHLPNGRVRTVSTGGLLGFPVDLAVDLDPAGSLVVVDAGPNQIVRVHPRNGSQTLITRDGFLHGASCLALADGEIFVTCVADPFGNFGVGRIVAVETRTGHQRLVSEGGFLCRPVGIVAAGNNSLFVADPYTPNPANDNAYDGAIIRIDLSTGQQELITRGTGSFVNPRAIVVVPETKQIRNKDGVAVEALSPFVR